MLYAYRLLSRVFVFRCKNYPVGWIRVQNVWECGENFFRRVGYIPPACFWFQTVRGSPDDDEDTPDIGLPELGDVCRADIPPSARGKVRLGELSRALFLPKNAKPPELQTKKKKGCTRISVCASPILTGFQPTSNFGSIGTPLASLAACNRAS